MEPWTSNKTITILSLALMAVLYQNFDVASMIQGPIHPVDQKVRMQHAKELLGRHYYGSSAHRAEAIGDLHMTIYQQVRAKLPKKYKPQALALSEAIISQSQIQDLDPIFVMAVINTESAFNPKARGQFGEIGLMQLKPDTAEWVANRYGLSWRGPSTLENPVDNVTLGIAYLSHLRETFSGFANKYLSAYNMGAAKVRKLYRKETTPREYSMRVMKNYREFYKKIVASRAAVVLSFND